MPLPTTPAPHRADENGCRRVRTYCLKCSTPIVLDFGHLSDAEIPAALRRIDTEPGECPGFHVEFGFHTYWQLDAVRDLLLPTHTHATPTLQAA